MTILKKDQTPLPIMDELSRKICDADFITKIDMKAGFHLLRMALGHEKFTAFRTRFGLYKYMVMPFGLTNEPSTFQQEISRIHRLLLGMELAINTKQDIDTDGGMVLVAYINDILIATKGSIDKRHQQVGNIFQLLMDNKMCVKIDKCIFDAKRSPLFRMYC